MEEVFDLLGHLLDKSLVLVEEHSKTARYHMLETIRQYALAKLAASGEADTVRRRHAEYYLALAGASYPSETVWLDRMETEHENLRAAVAWSQSVQGNAELGLRLAATVVRFWGTRGYWSEGRGWLETALAHAEGERVDDAQLRAQALLGMGFTCTFQGDYTAGETYFADSLKLYQELEDVSSSAFVLSRMGWLARERGDTTTARLRLEESLATFRKLGDTANIAESLNPLGEVLVMQEDTVGATRLLEESLTLSRKLRDSNGIGWALNHLGHVAQLQGEYERATRLHQESLPFFREVGPGWIGIPWAHQGLGETALAQGDSTLAATHLVEALGLFHDLGDRVGVSWCLAGIAGVAALDEEPERAAWLWGAAEALREFIGAREAPVSHATHERLKTEVRKQLGEAMFNAKWAEGQKASVDQAVDEAQGL
jgi:tetratricopeptide (TPR) repeat protein